MVSKDRLGSCPHGAYGSSMEDRCLNRPLKPSGIRAMLVNMQVSRGPQEATNPVGGVREDTDTGTVRPRRS